MSYDQGHAIIPLCFFQADYKNYKKSIALVLLFSNMLFNLETIFKTFEANVKPKIT